MNFLKSILTFAELYNYSINNLKDSPHGKIPDDKEIGRGQLW